MLLGVSYARINSVGWIWPMRSLPRGAEKETTPATTGVARDKRPKHAGGQCSVRLAPHPSSFCLSIRRLRLKFLR
jgi:hypothetical protein